MDSHPEILLISLYSIGPINKTDKKFSKLNENFICYNLEFMEIVRSIVTSVEFVWMFNFVEITNVVKVQPMMNVAFVWR